MVGVSECNSNEKWNNVKFRRECKNWQMCKENYSGVLLVHVFVRMVSIQEVLLKVTRCDEVINTVDSVSTNITSTVSTNFYNKSKI